MLFRSGLTRPVGQASWPFHPRGSSDSSPHKPARYNIGNVTKYIRYQSASGVSYGTLEGDTVHQLQGDLFDVHTTTGATHQLSDVKLLYPCEPGKILAVGLNYRSHLGTRPAPAHPEMFYKPVSALQNPQDPIVLPRDSTDVHSEGEMVVVVGKRLHHASEAEEIGRASCRERG